MSRTEPFDKLIEHSSLGTWRIRRARARTPASAIARVRSMLESLTQSSADYSSESTLLTQSWVTASHRDGSVKPTRASEESRARTVLRRSAGLIQLWRFPRRLLLVAGVALSIALPGLWVARASNSYLASNGTTISGRGYAFGDARITDVSYPTRAATSTVRGRAESRWVMNVGVAVSLSPPTDRTFWLVAKFQPDYDTTAIKALGTVPSEIGDHELRVRWRPAAGGSGDYTVFQIVSADQDAGTKLRLDYESDYVFDYDFGSQVARSEAAPRLARADDQLRYLPTGAQRVSNGWPLRWASTDRRSLAKE
jgi:hypothetical protein